MRRQRQKHGGGSGSAATAVDLRQQRQIYDNTGCERGGGTERRRSMARQHRAVATARIHDGAMWAAVLAAATEPWIGSAGSSRVFGFLYLFFPD